MMTRRQKNDRMTNSPYQTDGHREPLFALNNQTKEFGEGNDDLFDTTQQIPQAVVAPTFEHGERYHEAGKRDVELYIRTYNTLLRSSGEVSLKALVQAHYNIDSSLHPDARAAHPDMSAFIYSVLRLPT